MTVAAPPIGRAARASSVRRWAPVAFWTVLAVALLVLAGVQFGQAATISILAVTITRATPITLGALAGICSERTGVVNIGIEGLMLTSAFAGFMVGVYSQNLVVAVLAAVLSGMLMALLHAVLSITFRVDQIISGTVVNILAVGLTGYLNRKLFATGAPPGLSALPPLPLGSVADVPWIGPILLQQKPITLSAIVLVFVVHFALFRTRWGLRTRAVGEHPLAADTVGVNVNALRYLNVVLGGALAGLGGAYFTLESVPHFEPLMTNGRGFIALAAMIFGKWTPIGAFLASLLFACADALGARLQYLGVRVPYQFLGMLPYVLTIIVVAGAMGRAVAPAAVGRPYRKN